MSGAGNQILLVQVRGVGFEHLVSVRAHFHHDVAIAGGKYRGLNDFCAVEERCQLPVPIDVAVPIDAGLPMESRLLKRSDFSFSKQ
jgi:hypothetical protein